MTEYIPHVGDYVQIKGLGQLNDEYKRLGDGSFDTPGFLFVPLMRSLCGKTFHIDRIHTNPYGAGIYLRSVEGVENDRPGGGFWYISAGMVNLLDSGIEQEQDIDENMWLNVLF